MATSAPVHESQPDRFSKYLDDWTRSLPEDSSTQTEIDSHNESSTQPRDPPSAEDTAKDALVKYLKPWNSMLLGMITELRSDTTSSRRYITLVTILTLICMVCFSFAEAPSRAYEVVGIIWLLICGWSFFRKP